MADVDVNASVFLIGTKTKLAPIKSLTIPRLELNAALLLARWLSRFRDILAPQLNIVGINAWSDSTIVLSWLGAPHEAFKIYVSNRVHQIRTLLPDCRWRHVDSVNNPADCASRGIMPATLAQHKLYWHGPQLAYGDPSEWDDARSPLPLCDLPELRPVSCAARVDEIEVEWFNRFSSYDRMLRVVAYMRRFIAAGIRRVRRQPDHIAPAYLQKSELDSAARILEAESQRVHFVVLLHELSTGKHVSSKPLARLAPFIDPDGVIRVGGRLRHSLLTYDCQPLLAVPPKSGPEPAGSLSDRWKLMDQCHQSFWRRWSSEYLTTLQERSKWTRGVPNVKVDDMVVVVDNQSPPLMWRIGRIVELLPVVVEIELFIKSAELILHVVEIIFSSDNSNCCDELDSTIVLISSDSSSKRRLFVESLILSQVYFNTNLRNEFKMFN
ncbi:hypothetical protein QTP88_028601 [Uroleucon formosanum]